MKQLLDRAKWLYYYNGGSISKYDCVRKAIYELCDPKKLVNDLRPFNVSIGEYIEDLAKKI